MMRRGVWGEAKGGSNTVSVRNSRRQCEPWPFNHWSQF